MPAMVRTATMVQKIWSERRCFRLSNIMVYYTNDERVARSTAVSALV